MNQNYIKIIAFFALSLLLYPAFGQQTPVSEMYLIDYFYANPAETGRKNCLLMRLSDIHQWLGIKNAPNTQTLALHKGFKKEHHTTYHGLGTIVYRDQNGHYRSNGLKACYAFHILLNEQRKTTVSFGISGEFAQRALDESGFLNNNSDPALTGNGHSVWNPNADFGIILSNRNFNLGLSVLDLFPSTNTISEPVFTERRSRKYLFYFSKTLSVSHRITAEPSFMLKTNESYFNQLDLNTKVYFNEVYWLGFSYRHSIDKLAGNALNGIIYTGITVRNWSIDYSFSFSISNLQRYHYGTHGLTISYRICNDEKGAVPCPAYK